MQRMFENNLLRNRYTVVIRNMSDKSAIFFAIYEKTPTKPASQAELLEVKIKCVLK